MRVPTASLCLLLLGACATGVPPVVRADLPPPRAGSTSTDLETLLAAAPAPMPRKAIVGDTTTRLKVGAWYPSGDTSGLDPGFWAEAVFSKEILKLVALEASVGYFEASGRLLGASGDVWGVPLFLNGRVQLPVLVFEGYAGAGIGGVYVDYEAAGLGNSDFVAAWDAFLGLEFGLGGWGIGAEVKYLQTDDTKSDFAVEGTTTVIYASLGF